MKMSGMILAITMIVSLFIFSDVALAGRIGERQLQQQKRIHQGIRSGELTCLETRRLEREQNRVRMHKRIAWSDGRLTRGECIRLEQELDRSSRHIFRAKHNDIERQKH